MKQFEEEHNDAYPDSKIDGNGNPDTGSGWYSMRLPLKDWISLNSSLRVHLNSLEQLPNIVLTAPIAGFYLPQPTLAFTWGFLFFRLVYAIGYQKAPGSRVYGFLGGFLCVLGLFICSIISVVQMFQRDQERNAAATPPISA